METLTRMHKYIRVHDIMGRRNVMISTFNFLFFVFLRNECRQF